MSVGASDFGVFNGEGRHGAWMQTYTGRKFWPLDPRPEEIAIEDVAHGLSNVCRYGGHVRRFYCVAEHCLLMSLICPPEIAREALLHDLAEAYIGDMVRPLKHQPEMVAFRTAEAKIEAAAAARFGLRSDPAVWAAVKVFDDRIIVDEVGALMARPPDYWTRHVNVKATGTVIMAMDPLTAEVNFLLRFRELFPEWPSVAIPNAPVTL